MMSGKEAKLHSLEARRSRQNKQKRRVGMSECKFHIGMSECKVLSLEHFVTNHNSLFVLTSSTLSPVSKQRDCNQQLAFFELLDVAI
ncbi:unnamed protein product [Caenorhabditis nigoni]